MKSVGETMAIGRTFKESFQKALRGLEVGSFGFGCDGKDLWGTAEQPTLDEVRARLATPGDRAGLVHSATRIKYGMTARGDPRADGDRPLVPGEPRARSSSWKNSSAAAGGSATPLRRRSLRRAKQYGFSDRQLADALGHRPRWTSAASASGGDRRPFKSVDTCAAEFEAYTPYYYSTYEDEDETPASAAGQAADHDPRRRAEPHRPGDRVRLLLLPRQLRPARAGHPVDHGQLQPGDGVHRLRHQRPAVLRAADHRGRAEHLRRASSPTA